jgi:hypothetical protein
MRTPSWKPPYPYPYLLSKAFREGLPYSWLTVEGLTMRLIRRCRGLPLECGVGGGDYEFFSYLTIKESWDIENEYVV